MGRRRRRRQRQSVRMRRRAQEATVDGSKASFSNDLAEREIRRTDDADVAEGDVWGKKRKTDSSRRRSDVIAKDTVLGLKNSRDELLLAKHKDHLAEMAHCRSVVMCLNAVVTRDESFSVFLAQSASFKEAFNRSYNLSDERIGHAESFKVSAFIIGRKSASYGQGLFLSVQGDDCNLKDLLLMSFLRRIQLLSVFFLLISERNRTVTCD